VPVVRTSDLDVVESSRRAVADPLAGLPGAAPHSSVRVVRVLPGARTPHLHPDAEEIFYVLAGRGTTWEGDEEHSIGPGDVVVLPAGVPHVTVAADPEGLSVVAFIPHPDLAANTVELPGPERS
jgi:quercetin dioxygenase-like cupin family protein